MSDLDKLKKEAAKKVRNKQATQLARTLTVALQPHIEALTTELSNRLDTVAKKVDDIELHSPDTVQLGSAVEIKDPIRLTGLDQDTTFKKIVNELGHIKLAVGTEPKSFREMVDALAPISGLGEIHGALSEIYDLISNSGEREMTIRLFNKAEADPETFLPVRLTDGYNWYKSQFSGGGGGLMMGEDINGSGVKPIAVVESTATPGVFGVVVLNADGTSLSTGGGATDPDTLVDNLELQNGDDILLQSGDLLLTQ